MPATRRSSVAIPAVQAELTDVSEMTSPRKERKLSHSQLENKPVVLAAAKAHEDAAAAPTSAAVDTAAAPPVVAAPAGAAVGSRLPRYGYNKKRPIASVDPASTSSSGAAASDVTAPLALTFVPVDLVNITKESFGDLDSALELLRLKVAGTDLDRKTKLANAMEVVKQLKGGYASLIKSARGLGPDVLLPLQEDINGKLRELTEQASMQQTAAALAKKDLSETQAKLDDKGKKYTEEVAKNERLQKELTAHEERGDAEARRADRAEASLAKRDEELLASQEEVKALTAEKEAASAERAEAADASAKAAEAAALEIAELKSRLGAHKAEAEAALAEMTTLRDAEQSRAEKAEAALASASSELAALQASHASLSSEHKTLSEEHAATKAKLESVSAQLEEKTNTLKQKDDDLRDSIKNVTDMQKANQEVIAHERQRAQGLEDEARGLRDRVQSAEAAQKEAEGACTRVQAELEGTKHDLSTANTALGVSTTEQQRLAIETAEQREKLEEGAKRCEGLEMALNEAKESLAGVSATLEAKTTEADTLAREKHEVEVAFKSYQEHHGTNNLEQMNAISELKLTVDRLNTTVETKSVEASSAQGSLAQQAAYLAEMERKVNEMEAQRRALHNQVQELKGNIRVFCRVRPGGNESAKAIEASADTKLSIFARDDTHHFAFDKVFAPTATQEAVYAEVDGLVQSALDGYKVCIFAYGQTGSGKTYTMQGGAEPSQWGLIPRALSKILSLSESMGRDGWQWTLSASFLEIYNETIKDLLHAGKEAPAAGSYVIKKDDVWGSVVANMGRVEVSSMEQINKLMEKAAKARSVGATNMNAQSSRSHSIFALYLKGINTKLDTELSGALHLVDLAGSERVGKSGAEGAALKEAQAINKSLFTLTSVFDAKAKKAPCVPFRESQLTKLMEPCLSGNGKTLMLVNVAPETDNAYESLSSLRFAKQVNQCDTSNGKSSGNSAPKRNVASAGNGVSGSSSARR